MSTNPDICAHYSNHEFARIPMAAVHINMSSVV